MNEINLSSRLPSTGATQNYTPPRVGSEPERTPATSTVTTPTPDSGSTSPTQTVGSLSDTVSISSNAYRALPANSSAEAVDSTAGRDMSSEQAMARLQRVQEATTQNPQGFFQAQAGQISAQQVASVLRA